ncbi:MAG: hypothetical protein L0K67_14895 [Brevibacterium sp.]|nr:hypothetical protein [Brevibacterium sp.]
MLNAQAARDFGLVDQIL